MSTDEAEGVDQFDLPGNAEALPGGGLVEGVPAGNPGRTPEAELEARVAVTVELLSQGVRKSQIKRILVNRYQVSARTCENYLSRAREELLTDLREERDEHRGTALATYRALLRNPNAKVKDKILAQQRIDKLLGLEAPVRLAMTDTDGVDLPSVSEQERLQGAFSILSTEELEQLHSMRAKVKKAKPEEQSV